ncbi:MAG: YlbF family regulator [Limnochordia bacterium]|nr:YlbF family regulator [Bacillota bacterium]HOB09768.1 YlbF family regulator [Limnochordia bacterium]NLH32156.1 YlbF family regulator [Bacillota bacterium]HPT93881.1 YlbF family regulator [Limnochordia bacterium]HPZ31718.1 YlbF family regulator [Limnochordia bacterium]
MDIKEIAKQLADAIVESPEYQRLKQAREQLEQHHAAKVMLRDFHKKQLNLQKQHLEGTPVTESQVEELSKLYEVLNINPYIRDLFQAEMAFQKLMLDIQEVLGDAIDLEPLYELEDEEEEKPAEDAILKASKKLWVPGN